MQFKLVSTYILISFIPIFIFSLVILGSMENYLKNARSEKIIYDAKLISDDIIRNNYISHPNTSFDKKLKNKCIKDNYHIIIFDFNSNAIFDTEKNPVDKKIIVNELPDSRENYIVLKKNEHRLYTYNSILNNHQEKLGTVLIITAANEIFDAIHQIKTKLFLLMACIFMIILVFVFFISNLIMEPLKNILSVIEKMSAGELDQRIKITRHDEFAHLATSFNKMTDKLEQIENTRKEFVSNVSHELKTPLSAIKVLSESMLNEKDIPLEIYQEFLSDINSEIDRMTNIVNDLLTLVKLDKKRFPLNISDTNLNNMIENIIKRLLPLADKKNIELEFNHNKNVVLQADEMKLSLAISNLIDNGIKYTQNGGKVKINIDSDDEFAYITIQDNGIGINEKEKDKVFERFYRIDKTRDRETGGTGLGLSITRSTIIMHNGNIKLTSDEGLGTTFFITLPLSLAKNN